MQAVENLQDALLESRATHNAVVDDYQIILSCFYGTVCYVIYMSSEVVTLITFADEGTQLYVLPHHLLCPDIIMCLTYSACHAIEGNLCCVGDK